MEFGYFVSYSEAKYQDLIRNQKLKVLIGSKYRKFERLGSKKNQPKPDPKTRKTYPLSHDLDPKIIYIFIIDLNQPQKNRLQHEPK